MVVSRQAGRTLGVRGSSFTYRRLLTAGGGILLLMFAVYTWITSPFGPGGKMVRGYLKSAETLVVADEVDTCMLPSARAEVRAREEEARAREGTNDDSCVDKLPDCVMRPEEYCKQDPGTKEGCRKRCKLCGEGAENSPVAAPFEVTEVSCDPPPASGKRPPFFYDVNDLFPELEASLAPMHAVIRDELSGLQKSEWRSGQSVRRLGAV